MTINPFNDSEFYASVNHNTGIPGTWKPINARAALLYHVPIAMLLWLPKKVCMFRSNIMHMQIMCIPVLKIFSLFSYKYV